MDQSELRPPQLLVGGYCFQPMSDPARGGEQPQVQKAELRQNFLWAPADGVLPVATCFTARRLRVSVFSRTAIHAPGGWALIENLPNVLTGDRVTVGLSSTYLLPHRQNFVSRVTEEWACFYIPEAGDLLRQGPRFKGETAARLGL